MKKLTLFLGLMLVPTVCLAQHPRVVELMKLKQQKMEELEKCEGVKKKLTIAGVSTLGLTAVGVAGNIAEAHVIKEYDRKIDNADKSIQSAQKELDEKKKDLLAKEEEARNQAVRVV